MALEVSRVHARLWVPSQPLKNKNEGNSDRNMGGHTTSATQRQAVESQPCAKNTQDVWST
jgi:hypothetical protein